MKAFGVILIAVGILMLIFTRVNFTTKDKVIDAGPIEINKEEKHSIDWPTYAGIGIAVIGAFVLIGANRKKS
ncbi:MAG: hypothetical protein H7Y00_00265 [Fimbriimonadaceae bacterium]|nr:hypothetical protein [Chitinophagales bacterium]